MNMLLRRHLPLGLCLAFVTHGALAADMDKPLFAPRVQYAPPTEAQYVRRTEALSGFVEGSFGYGQGEAEGFEAEGSAWALRGSVNGRLDRTWNLQIDGVYSRMSVEGVDVDALTGAAHAYYRDPDRFAVGAFVQGSRFSSNVLDMLAPLGLDDHAVDIVGGGEAAIFAEFATLYGQFGFGQASYSGFDADHLLAKGGVRLYATDNLRFDVEGSFNRFSVSGGDADLYAVSAAGNYRFGQYPITAFAGYRYDHGALKSGGSTLGTLEVHNVLAGLRFSFGSATLKDEERNGALWSPSPLNL